MVGEVMGQDDARPGGLSSLCDGAVPSPPKASIPDAREDFLHQLRRVNTERYDAWAERPIMLCEHCGADEWAATERCAPPFTVREHEFTREHPYLTTKDDAGIMFDAVELGGEVGELLNVVKKLKREDRSWRGSRADPDDFADECADVLICLDKLARRRGVDLVAATVRKFNATSEKVGLPQKLSAQGMETGTAKTERLGPKDDSPVGTMRPDQGTTP